MTSQPREFTPRAPIALITCEAGRSFAQRVADSMNVPLAPSVEKLVCLRRGKDGDSCQCPGS